MIRELLQHPTSTDLLEFFERHLHQPATIIQVIGECEVLYKGRAASVAEAGDSLVIIKADGSVQVHDYRGVKPLNWQPHTDRLTVEDSVDGIILTAERFQPEELVQVVFVQANVVIAANFAEQRNFLLMGSEAEMQRALAANPEIIESGLETLDIELPTTVGGIDLLARDAQGNVVVVELKRGKATQEAVHQLHRYVQAVAPIVGARVRGVLAAPRISKPALNQLGALDLEFREITALDTATPVESEQISLFATLEEA